MGIQILSPNLTGSKSRPEPYDPGVNGNRWLEEGGGRPEAGTAEEVDPAGRRIAS